MIVVVIIGILADNRNYVTSVTAVGAVITVVYGGAAPAHAIIAGNDITLTANDNSGSVSWVCNGSTGGAIADKHLPAACR